MLDSHLAQAAALLIAQQRHPENDDVNRETPPLHHYARRVSFQVWHDEQLVLRSVTAPADSPMAPFAQGFQDVELRGEQWRVFATRGAERDVRVYVAERADARYEILWGMTRALVAPSLVALPLLASLVAFALWRGLAPLRGLGALLSGRAPEAIEPVTIAPRSRELQSLVHALNGLLGRIAKLLQAERRFTADAAHELRTPLAAVRAQAQVALAATDEASRRHALLGTLEGCDRASHLVDQLLLLSRLDHQGPQTSSPLDLAVLARRVLAELASRAVAKDQTIELDAPDHWLVNGNEVLLGALLRNLVDNAVRYSPSGARVRVRIDKDAITVDDSGPGLEPSFRARLGERFARATGTGGSGSGLGWSIVRQIADAHGLQVRAEPSPLGGLRAVVQGFDDHSRDCGARSSR